MNKAKGDKSTGLISDRRKRKCSVNTDTNDSPNQKNNKKSGQSENNKRRKQTKNETNTNKFSSVTDTSANISTNKSKKRKLYSCKDESDLFNQNENYNIDCETNKPVHLTVVSDMDNAFDRLKMMSPNYEQNVNSNYSVKLRSCRNKVFNFSSDTDDDNDYVNNSKFAKRIRQKSSSNLLKKSTVKKSKTKNIQSNKKSSHTKINNPLIDERVRKSHTEVLDTSITCKDYEGLIEPDLKSQHICPEVTIIYPTTDLNNSHTSVTSLNVEIEEPNVNSSDNFLAKVNNMFKTNGTNMFQTSIVSSPQHEIFEKFDQQLSVQDEQYERYIAPANFCEVTSSPKEHNDKESNKEKAHDEIVPLEQVQQSELNDETSSPHFQIKKSRQQMLIKRDVSKIQKSSDSVQDKSSVKETKKRFNDRSRKGFQTKIPIAKIEKLKNRDKKQHTKEPKGDKDKREIVQTNNNVDDNNIEKSKFVIDNKVTIAQPIKPNSIIVTEKVDRKENPILEYNQNENFGDVNWDTFLETDGQQPSIICNTSTPKISLTESQESKHIKDCSNKDDKPSILQIDDNDTESSHSVLVKHTLRNCHRNNVEEETVQLSIPNETSQGEMLNTSEHSQTEDLKETIIKLLNDINKQNLKFLTDVANDTESLLGLLLQYNTKIFKQYMDKCTRQNKVIIEKLKTSLQSSLEENNQFFEKIEELLRK